MAKSLSKSNIVTNNTILASDVSQSIDALTGDVAYDIVISGSLETTGSVDISGLLTATSGITHQLTASNAVSASFASTATSASYADNVPAGGLPSGLLSSSAQIASDISGAFGATSASLSSRVAANEVVTAKTLVSSSAQIATEISGAFGEASASFSTRVSANEGNISTNTTNITTLTSKTGSYATTGSNQFNGDQQITGSLIVSGSTTSTIKTNRVRIGDYFVNGGAAVSQAEELYLSGSGVQRAVIESSDTAAILQLKSPTGKSAAIDFEEGPDQRWIIGLSASNENFVIATGSALSEGVLFQVNRTSKDVEVINNLSASAVSASTYYGDGSNLTGITSVWKDETTYISSSVPIKVDGAITASGNISASGDIISNKYILDGDENSYIELNDTDSIRIVAGGQQMISFDHDTGDRIITGFGKDVGIGIGNTSTPGANLHVLGNIWASGSNGHITASGDISSSGTIITENGNVKNNLTVGGDLDIADTIYHTGDSNTKIRFPSNDTIAFNTSGVERFRIDANGHITASGNISASGIVYGETGSFSHLQGNSPINVGSGVHFYQDITASGNISASAASTASFGTYIGDGSQLTNVSAFPFVGDAVITGSLTISGSQIFTMDNDNVILGVNAGGGGINPPTDTANVIIGPSAAGEGSLNNGSKNVIIGSGSAHGLKTGDDCVVIGTEALYAADDVGNHIAIGYRALYNHDSGNNNIAIGHRAFYDTSGAGSSTNIVIGDTAGYNGVRQYNIVIGCQAMYASSGADYNVVIGYKAGYNNDGDDNIYIGNQAAEAATTGDNNIIIGNEVEKSAADASNEIKIGDSSVVPFSASLSTGDVLFPSTASAAYFSGDGSNLTNVSAFPFTGDAVITGSLTISGSFNAFRVDSDDVVLGLNAGASLTSATSRAVLIGYNAGDSITTGLYNIGIGFDAIATATTEMHGSTAVGYSAGKNIVEGDYNTTIGYAAGMTISNGDSNVAVGYFAMGTGTVTGDNNVALGYHAGADLTSGNHNVFIGMDAGNANTTGFRNVYIGASTGDSGVGGDYNIAIGDTADVTANVDGQISIGRSVTTTGAGDIKIGSGSSIPFSGSAVTGDVVFPSTASAAYFSGDGSNLTNVSAFPFVGDAIITGSLTISGSQAFTLDASNVVLGKNAGGGSVDTGTDDNNVIIGTDAVGGGSFNSGDGNIAIGHSAAEGLTTGDENIAIGTNAAGGGAFSGTKCVVIGSNAGLNLGSTSDYNIIIGENAGATLSNSNVSNVMIGRYCGNAAPAGTNYVTLIGNNAGRAISAASDGAVLIGSWAGVGAAGAANVAIGQNAIRGGNDSYYSSNTNIIKNIAIGDGAGRYIDGHQNIFIGHDVAGSTSLGAAHNNTIIGFEAAASLTTGEGNIIIGPSVDVNGATSDHHLRIGSGSVITISGSLATGDVLFPSTASAAYFSGDGSQLTNVSAFPFVGDAVITGSLVVSGSNGFRMDSSNVVLGANAGGGSVDTGTDDNNVIIGADAAGGGNLNSGDNSVIIGHEAGYNKSSGDGQVIIGHTAGKYVGAGNTNVFIGQLAGGGSGAYTPGGSNIAIGYYANAAQGASAGSNNVVIGIQAAQQKVGSGNVILGTQAMYNAATGGDSSVIIGYYAGWKSAGDENIFIGYETGKDATSGNNNILIGKGVEKSAITNSDELKIGNESVITISGSLATGYLHDVKADNLTISSSGTVLPSIESSDGIAALKLKSGGSHAYIDMDEGADQRWIAGMYTNDNSYRIASGSAFASNTIFELEQDGQARFSAGVEISGSITYPNASIVTYTNDPGSYTLTSDEHLVLIDAASGTVTITLPDAATYPGREIHFKVTTNPGGNTITLQRAGSDTIDGATSNTSLDTQYEAISVISDGSSQWFIF